MPGPVAGRLAPPVVWLEKRFAACEHLFPSYNKLVDEKATHWVDLAGYDMDTAKAMLQAGRLLYVGFMCHQVVEKMLKTWWVSAKGSTPPYTHSLVALATPGGLLGRMSWLTGEHGPWNRTAGAMIAA